MEKLEELVECDKSSGKAVQTLERQISCDFSWLQESRRSNFAQTLSIYHFLGGIRGTLQREPLLNPLLALLNRDRIQRVYIPQGSNPISYHSRYTVLSAHSGDIPMPLVKSPNVVRISPGSHSPRYSSPSTSSECSFPCGLCSTSELQRISRQVAQVFFPAPMRGKCKST